jgi:hypothetical protein
MLLQLVLHEFPFLGDVIRNDITSPEEKAAACNCIILWVICFTNIIFFFLHVIFWWIANISENTTQHHTPEDSSSIHVRIAIAVRTLNIRLLRKFSHLMECVKWDWAASIARFYLQGVHVIVFAYTFLYYPSQHNNYQNLIHIACVKWVYWWYSLLHVLPHRAIIMWIYILQCYDHF